MPRLRKASTIAPVGTPTKQRKSSCPPELTSQSKPHIHNTTRPTRLPRFAGCKTRQPDKWRNQDTIHHSGTIEQRILAMTPEERVAAGAR
jgi:hypothetical protein